MEQLPLPVSVATFSDTVQIVGVFEVNVTANPDEVVAVKVAEFDTVSGGCAKVMVWVAVLLPHSTNVAPLTVTVLAPLTKFGRPASSPMGAKETVAVMAPS